MKHLYIQTYESKTGEAFSDLTDEQKESVFLVIERQGFDNLEHIWAPTTFAPYVGLQFSHIFIGVEPDGYAHS